MKLSKTLVTLSFSLLLSAPSFAEGGSCKTELTTSNKIAVSVISSKDISTLICKNVSATEMHLALQACAKIEKENVFCKWHDDKRSITNVSMSVDKNNVYEVILTKLGS